MNRRTAIVACILLVFFTTIIILQSSDLIHLNPSSEFTQVPDQQESVQGSNFGQNGTGDLQNSPEVPSNGKFSLPATQISESRSDSEESPDNITTATTDALKDEIQPTNENSDAAASLVSYPKWSKVEIAFQGPHSHAANDPNPFKIQVDVVFKSPQGIEYKVPAFFDGDGKGGLSGAVWKVRFAPNSVGKWDYITRSSHSQLDGKRGAFSVTQPGSCQAYTPGGLPDFACSGMLQYVVGKHHLKFVDGGYWLKGGIDDPENFLGDVFGDWKAKKAAIDLLHSKGVNSVYIITNTIHPGDGNDTWPWQGQTSEEAKANSNRFNISKLHAWEDFFGYVQSKGIVLHLVLDDDSAWNGYDRNLYYREMVARFGHHLGLIWNIGEEANEIYSDSEQISHAKTLKELDPYKHPVTVHRNSNWPFLGHQQWDLASVQAGDGASEFGSSGLMDYYELVENHIEESRTKGHPIPIMIDEIPTVKQVAPAIRDRMRKQVIYPIYLAGGNFELHYYDAYNNNDGVSIRDLSPILNDLRLARGFVENAPFFEMETCNNLLKDSRGKFCFGKTGKAYLIYSTDGSPISINFSRDNNKFNYRWLNPRNGDVLDGGAFSTDGKTCTFSAPDNNDWLLSLERNNRLSAETFSAENFLVRMDSSMSTMHNVFLPLIKSSRFSVTC